MSDTVNADFIFALVCAQEDAPFMAKGVQVWDAV